ncbi:MAG: Ig-like domain-containing protein [bacterium]
MMRNKNILVVGVFLIASLVVYILYYFFISPIVVVTTSVEQDARDIERSLQINITFDKKLFGEEKNLKISSVPEIEWEVSKLEGEKNVWIKPKTELESGTEYTLTIFGKRVKNYTLKFTTKDVEFGVGSPSAQDAFENYERVFPLLKYLPYKTEKYTIMQREKDEYFVIVFGIYESELENIKKEVFAWFQAKGVNPESVKIDFE